jgi:hypothetical protein
MPSGPPRRLEKFVGLWIPPACREEVLGDLHEKYTGPWQYISLALSVIPFVILSRIRRTTDALILLTEALLIYGSFLAAAWYTDRTLLNTPNGLQRLAIPTALNLFLLILDNTWDFKRIWSRALINGIAISICVYFSFAGQLASVLLVWAVEFWFRRGSDLPQRTAGGPALWLKHRSGPAVISRNTKSRIAAAGAVTLSAIVVTSIGAKPWMVGTVAVVVAVWFVFDKSGKE